MKDFSIRYLIALPMLGVVLAGAVVAAGIETTPMQNAPIDDFAAGKKAIDAKNWSEAANRFGKVIANNPRNADAYNYLGYSLRWLGKYDEAFAAYGKALALDPRHKGALEYSGLAYLKTNQKPRAQARLAQLEAICATCEETRDLARALAAAQ